MGAVPLVPVAPGRAASADAFTFGSELRLAVFPEQPPRRRRSVYGELGLRARSGLGRGSSRQLL